MSYLKRKTPLKRGGRLKPMSDKRRSQNVLYINAKNEWREDRIRKDGQIQCQWKGKPYADSEGFGVTHDDLGRCIMPANQSPHHKAGREGSLLWDKRWFMAICDRHHHILHFEEPALARKRGYLIERTGKSQ